jgi:hypothetical protein
MRGRLARSAGVIRIDAVWPAMESLDLRCGLRLTLARVVAVFGAVQPHHACLLTKRHVLGGRGPLAGARADFNGACDELTLKGPNGQTGRKAEPIETRVT